MLKKALRCLVSITGHQHVDLSETQWWTLEDLQELQEFRLRKIVKYACNNIPGYRKKFDQARISPEHIRSLDDLSKIPVTTREELQNNSDFVNARLISGTLYTGGSTGTSLKYYESKESGKIRWNAHLRGWSWNGYKPGKRLAVIASAQGIVKEENTLNLSGDLTTVNLQKNIKELQKFRPQHLRGYVGSLYILAKYCLDNDISIEGIESIDPISENLYDFQRTAVEKAFDCPVYEEYCCNDGGACAWECDTHEGLHYFMERAIIEDIDGEMVVTDLWNRAMPFIRYKNGDSVTFLDKKCSCGRELPLIKVKGRDNDIIITKAGIISPTFIMHNGIGIGTADHLKTKFRDGIRTVQYVQKPNYILEVYLVKNPWCSNEEIRAFEEKVSYIAEGMSVKINYVDDIPSTKKGKRAFIINEDKDLLNKWKVN
jgi:phenylacetate-CoA ligase